MSTVIKNIHILSDETINQIAAGEVVEHPASVVKELVENAIDAGAQHITIETSGGGFQLLKVIDDGIGMSPEDALLSLQRHTTSKIRTAHDMTLLTTMGFRGEALASIAAISKITLITALAEASGVRIEVEGGKVVHIGPAPRTRGTTIEVRSLFYNVPARKAFQKSAPASTAEITKIASSLALAHFLVSFELFHQQTLSFSTPISTSESSQEALQRRAAILLGEEASSSSYFLAIQEPSCAIWGLVGDPLLARHNRTGQHLFVNHRPVQCLALAFAIRDGYGTRLDKNRHPFYVLHLNTLPSLIDVNVHPQKKEIRLKEERGFKESLRSAVALALQRAESVHAPHTQIPFFLGEQVNPLPSPTEDSSFVFHKHTLLPATNNRTLSMEVADKPLKQLSLPLKLDPQCIGLFRHYLLLDAKSVLSLPPLQRLATHASPPGIIWVDLIAAESCILFEQLLSSSSTRSMSQGLLVPLTFSFSKAEAALLHTCLPELVALGIHIRDFGVHSFIVDGLPSYLKASDLECFLQETLLSLDTFKQHMPSEQIKNSLAKTICSFHRSQKHMFSLQEAVLLFQALLNTASPFYCPQGKKTLHHVDAHDIQNYFAALSR